MAKKFEWGVIDYAAKDVINTMLDPLEESLRGIENLTQDQISYNRIRDLKLGRRAPVKLSEFVILCSVSHYLPSQGLELVLSRVNQLEQEEYDYYNQREKEENAKLLDKLMEEDREEEPEPEVSAVEPQQEPSMVDSVADEVMARILSDPNKYGLVANMNDDKENEAETPDE